MTDGGPLAGRRILVTGASGIVGRSILPDLLRAGACVCSVSRNTPDWYQALPSAGRHLAFKNDLRTTVPPADQLATITDCVHLAATLFPRSSMAFFHDNILITKNIASALLRHARNLRRFIHVSSLAARGPGTSADYRDPHLDARAVSRYGELKFACEMVATSLLQNAAQLSILRPGIVLSRHDRRLLLTARSFRSAPSFVLQRLPEEMSAVAVEDLSQAIVAALTSSPALAGVFEIGHSQHIRLRDAAGRSRKAPRSEERIDPGWLLMTMAAASTTAAYLTGSPPLLTFDKLREVQHSRWCIDPTPFMAATGWRAKIHPYTFLQPYLEFKAIHATA